MIVSLMLSMTVWAGVFHKTIAVDPPPAAGATAQVVVACTGFEGAGLALDATLPIITSGWADSCVPDATAAGNRWRVTTFGLQLLSWASATLFVAGYTRIIRDP